MSCVANSSRPTLLVLQGLCNNILGTKQKSFHALIWPTHRSTWLDAFPAMSLSNLPEPSAKLMGDFNMGTRVSNSS